MWAQDAQGVDHANLHVEFGQPLKLQPQSVFMGTVIAAELAMKLAPTPAKGSLDAERLRRTNHSAQNTASACVCSQFSRRPFWVCQISCTALVEQGNVMTPASLHGTLLATNAASATLNEAQLCLQPASCRKRVV